MRTKSPRRKTADTAEQSRVAHLKMAAGMLVAVVLLSTAGYVFVEDWTLLDAFYMTVTTISTVGFTEVHALSPAGRALTIAVIFCGVGTAGYSIGLLVQAVMGGEIRRFLGRSRLDEEIAKLTGHVIVCGLGTTGQLLCEELAESGVSFVAVDRSPERLQEVGRRGWLHMLGDASDGTVLGAAGIERACGLAAVLPTDAENAFVTLTARQMNRELKIISRAERPQTVAKLRTAGADQVVSTHMIGARRIAQLITRPDLVDFVEVVTSRGPAEFQMEELRLAEGSPLVGRTIADSRIRQQTGATIVAVKRADGTTILGPAPDTRLDRGDTLIVIGPRGAAGRIGSAASQ